MCGALPHAPAGEGRFRARRTERASATRQTFHGHRERRTERPYGRQIKRCTRETKPPSLQTSKLPLAPSPPARLRRAKGRSSRRYRRFRRYRSAPYGATGEDFRRPTRRETEGGGRGQRRSRRVTDGARSGSRPLLRLCGKAPPFSGRLCRPTHLSTISTEL